MTYTSYCYKAANQVKKNLSVRKNVLNKRGIAIVSAILKSYGNEGALEIVKETSFDYTVCSVIWYLFKTFLIVIIISRE